MKICKTPEAREALALLNTHLFTNVNVCMHVCVYINPDEGSEEVTCLPFCQPTQPQELLSLPLHVGFAFVPLGLFSSVNTHRL